MTRRQAVALAAAVGAVVLAHLLDRWAYANVVLPSAADRDWGRLLRILGFAPTWLAVAGLFWLESRRGEDGRELRVTAQALVLAVAVCGVLSEVVKLLVRRERPSATADLYQFRPFEVDPFSSRGLGMPSGHTTVAFAGAGALSRRYPRAAPLLLALAAGCGLTRVWAQAHFLSDVVAAAVGAGWLGSAIAGRLGRARPAT
jgi:membrane-associated phospholipid phosphatase